MTLSVWGDGHIDVGHWCELQNVSVRKIGTKPCLSTTLQTKMTRLKDLGGFIETAEDDIVTMEGEIVDTQIRVSHLCPKFHKMNTVNASTLMNHCNQCDAFCKTTKIKSILNGHITIDVKSTHNKIVMDDGNFRQLLNFSQEFKENTDDLASQILSHDNLKVEMFDHEVLRAVFIKVGECSSAVPGSSSSNATMANAVCDAESLGLNFVFPEDPELS
ncbi:uncharacterized protein [Misgurnus anguillicaudatus]|uniref:uncharacterized protein n=1 Tax=Misgurnus anguillicaudatus TaxID=75329 RepID=UPI003CCFB7AA